MDKNDDGYLDYLGLKKFYNAIKKKLIKTDDTLTKNEDDVISVSLPVKAMTTAEYERLSKEEKMAEVQYMITDDNGPTASNDITSNKNLLDNWYFIGGGSQKGVGQFPINQRGDESYAPSTSFVYGIDRWESVRSGIELTTNGIKVSWNGSGSNSVFRQIIEGAEFYGKQITASILYNNNELYSFSLIAPINNNEMKQEQSDLHPYIAIQSLNGNLNFAIYCKSSVTSYIIKAAKLELGPIQTLAHKEGDTWVLNEIPNYAEQYVICKQYSPVTGEFVGSQHSNQNLLDNWYFVGGGSQQGGGEFPINQRNKIEYTGKEYAIDRWQVAYNPNNYKLLVTSNGLRVDTSKNEDFIIWQRFESSVGRNILAGNIVTVSLLTEDGELLSGTGIFPKQNDADAFLISRTDIRVYLQWSDASFDFPALGISLRDASKTISAVKLELGEQQTLAHKDGDKWVLNDPLPNYALELLKCQRYQYTLNKQGISLSTVVTDGNGMAYFPITLPTSMRMENPKVVTSGGIRVHSSDTNYQNVSILTAHTNGNMVALAVNGLISYKAYSLDMYPDGMLIIDANF